MEASVILDLRFSIERRSGEALPRGALAPGHGCGQRRIAKGDEWQKTVGGTSASSVEPSPTGTGESPVPPRTGRETFDVSRWYFTQNGQKHVCKSLIFRRLRLKPAFFGAFLTRKGVDLPWVRKNVPNFMFFEIGVGARCQANN
jgi:hypothetical protein